MNTKIHIGSSGSISFFGILQIVFIVLKFCGLIDWAWPVVLIPLWIELGLVALIFIIIGILYYIIKKY